MPMDRTKYPKNWADIARAIKDAAGWKCEKCKHQCRFPDEPFDTHRNTLPSGLRRRTQGNATSRTEAD